MLAGLTPLLQRMPQTLLRALKSLGMAFLVLLLVPYFSFHIARGEYGLLSWWIERGRLLEERRAYEAQTPHLRSLELEVNALRPASLSPVMIEIEATKHGYGSERDMVIRSTTKNGFGR